MFTPSISKARTTSTGRSRLARTLLLCGTLSLLASPAFPQTNRPAAGAAAKVYIIPIREDIMPPLTYLVRRGVKEAMEAKADAIILDMKTNGGRVDVTEEIIEIIARFSGLTVTYVNNRAFSAGAFIAVGTQKIYMAPQSVIGAAAPIVMSPGGGGVEKLPDTMEIKMNSAVRAMIRAQAEKNGHNVDVVEAMIDKTKEFLMDGEVLNREGSILTLTDRQAAKQYGTPPRPLLSLGTEESLDTLLATLGLEDAQRIEIKPTEAETLGFWINAISPILLIIGMLGLYIEFKTPGFGLPGIVGITAFALYFLGGYVAGLAGLGWAVVFVVGVALLLVELLLFPGTFVAGVAGVVLMLTALVMGMVDLYPGGPLLPTFGDLQLPLLHLALAITVSGVGVMVLTPLLPHTPWVRRMVSQGASGETSLAALTQRQASRIGLTGVAVSPLHPGGKARFGEELLDVMTQGELIAAGRALRIIAHSGPDAVVEEIP
jgi:membrane-bound serine protease (ClpP class)